MAKKKLTKAKVVADEEVIEDPIEYAEEVDESIEDMDDFVEDIENPLFEKEEVEGTIEVPEDLMSDSVFQAEDIPPPAPASPEPQWTSKTFFDFTYNCCHPENDSHCIECYNKARKG